MDYNNCRRAAVFYIQWWADNLNTKRKKNLTLFYIAIAHNGLFCIFVIESMMFKKNRENRSSNNKLTFKILKDSVIKKDGAV